MEVALDRAIEKYGLPSLKPEQKSNIFWKEHNMIIPFTSYSQHRKILHV